MRVLGWIAMLLGVVLSALGGAVMAGWFVVATVVAWIAKKATDFEKWRRPVALLICLALLVVWPWQVWRSKGSEPRSIASSSLPVHEDGAEAALAAVRSANLTPQLDELALRKEELGRDVFKLRAQANSVERALALKATADRLIASAQSANQPITEVIDAKRAVDEALEKRGLDSGEALKSRKQALEGFLQDALARAGALKDERQAQDFLTDFRLRAPKVAIDDVNDRMLKLESAIMQLRRDAITKDIAVASEFSAKVDPAGKRLVRELVVTLTSSNLDLQDIDASELLLLAEPAALEQTLRVGFGSDSNETRVVRIARSIPVAPGIKTVRLVLETVVGLDVKPVPTPYRISQLGFPSFTLKWPAPRAVKLRTSVDLSKSGGPDQFPFAFDLNSDARIATVKIPANALFMSTYSFKGSHREAEFDVLESNDDLKPSYFALHNHLYFELLPDTALARNSVVQGWKNFLFPENLAATIAVALLAAVIAVALP